MGKKVQKPKTQKNKKNVRSSKRQTEPKGADKEVVAVAVTICILLGAIVIVVFMFLQEMNMGVLDFSEVFPFLSSQSETTEGEVTQIYEIVVEEYVVYYNGEEVTIAALKSRMAEDYTDGVKFAVVDSNAIKSVYDDVIKVITDNDYAYSEK